MLVRVINYFTIALLLVVVARSIAIKLILVVTAIAVFTKRQLVTMQFKAFCGVGECAMF
ncbi:MAG: hypothetical protein Tsb0014_05970 [Pleurocapsa sp.]